MRPAILAVVLLFTLASSASALPTPRVQCKGGVCFRSPFLKMYVGPGSTVDVRHGLFGLRRTNINTR